MNIYFIFKILVVALHEAVRTDQTFRLQFPIVMIEKNKNKIAAYIDRKATIEFVIY